MDIVEAHKILDITIPAPKDQTLKVNRQRMQNGMPKEMAV